MVVMSLVIFDGLAWSMAYLLIIRRGFIDKSFGMPIFAICLNISWESIFSFVYPHDKPQIFIDYAWFFLDLIILFQVFRNGPSELSKYSRKQFFGFLSLCVISALSIELLFIRTFDPSRSGMILANLQNVIMSILFLSMLNSRNTIRGQSFYIALFKMLGTLSISIVVFIYGTGPEKPLLIILSIWIFIFDLMYLLSLYGKCIECSVNPLRRL